MSMFSIVALATMGKVECVFCSVFSLLQYVIRHALIISILSSIRSIIPLDAANIVVEYKGGILSE